jgi:hypothetical protein
MHTEFDGDVLEERPRSGKIPLEGSLDDTG